MLTPDLDVDQLLSHLDPPMTVVTTVAGGQRAGCLLGFHAQCSIDPHRYALWLSKANHTLRVALHAQHVAVHFLGQDNLELARVFGTLSGDDVDKFSLCDWEPGPGGVPVLAGCGHMFVGERVAVLDEGSDHMCFVLAPTSGRAEGAFQPLRLSQVTHLQPGHEAEERPQPRSTRA